MKLAFASCMDTINDPVQEGWAQLALHTPTHLVLLGDSIYMDYGLGNHQPNGSPRGEPLDKFSRLMHAAYKAQWEVLNFRRAIENCKVFAIWDDHDYAWNNARSGGMPIGHDYVPPAYRRVSRLHFETFRSALETKPAFYPPNPAPDGVTPQDLGSIESTIALAPSVSLHLVDARSFREEEGGSSMLGAEQRQRLEAALLPPPGINILASSSTVKGWKDFGADYAWLGQMAATHRILVLSGDIHEPDFRARGPLFEATASAIAQPPGLTAFFKKRTQVFGTLGIDPDRLTVQIFVGDKLVEDHSIKRADWSL